MCVSLPYTLDSTYLPCDSRQSPKSVTCMQLCIQCELAIYPGLHRVALRQPAEPKVCDLHAAMQSVWACHTPWDSTCSPCDSRQSPKSISKACHQSLLYTLDSMYLPCHSRQSPKSMTCMQLCIHRELARHLELHVLALDSRRSPKSVTCMQQTMHPV